MESRNRKNLFRAMVCAVGLLTGGQAVRAASNPIFVSATSSATLIHTEDLGAAVPVTSSVVVPGASIPAVSSGFQMVHTFSEGGGTSSTNASAGIFQITSATQMGTGLVAGTGVTQSNVPGLFYTGASQLEDSMNFNWTLPPQGFPQAGHFPGVNFSFALGGTVGIGGFTEFKIGLKFFDRTGVNPAVQVGQLDFDHVFNTPGAFASVVSGSVLLNGGSLLPGSSNLQMIGTIDFLAKNDLSESDISIQTDGVTGPFDSVDNNLPNDLPEPGMAGLMGIGILLLFGRRNRDKSGRIA